VTFICLALVPGSISVIQLTADAAIDNVPEVGLVIAIGFLFRASHLSPSLLDPM
jgi:hypothetical protein